MVQNPLDVIQVCQPCTEMIQNFGVVEWLGLVLLCAIALVSFFTKKNLFSFAKDGYSFIKFAVGYFKKDDVLKK